MTRLRLDELELVGTQRTVSLEPGLNVITGPIASGKTTFFRLCRAALGSQVATMPPEVQQSVSAVRASLVIGDEQFRVFRPLVSTQTAKVEVAGSSFAARLPALQRDATADQTYGEWLLSALGLPRLRVPQAPTRPDSDLVPVSINDFMIYCVLPQDEIDTSVFGHTDHFKNVKRKYVFEILYGMYDVRIATLHSQLREVDNRLRAVSVDEASLERMLRGTAWENRSALELEVAQARAALQTLEQQASALASRSEAEPRAETLKARHRQLSETIDATRNQLVSERASLEELETLEAQLISESSQLTRSIVASEYLVDFDFVRCPRCGTPVDAHRQTDDVCYLCLQPPQQILTRESLIEEQDRLSGQIIETRELIGTRRSREASLSASLARLVEERSGVEREINTATSSFVSAEADSLIEYAERRARLQSSIARNQEYLSVLDKLLDQQVERAVLEVQKEDLLGQIEAAQEREQNTSARLANLDRIFEETLESFRIPPFGDILSSRIDRETYLPIVHGRRFSELSSQGLQVLVNVAYATTHHVAALTQGLQLPNFLMLDGPTSNVGHRDLDETRVEAVYAYLVALSERFGDQLQVIVVDNDIPDIAEPFVRLRLSEQDRLVPTA